MPRTLASCGTYGAYQRHIRRGEEVDQACSDAKNAYMAGYRQTHPEYRQNGREAVIELAKAHRIVAQRHPEELEQVRADLRRERLALPSTPDAQERPAPGGE